MDAHTKKDTNDRRRKENRHLNDKQRVNKTTYPHSTQTIKQTNKENHNSTPGKLKREVKTTNKRRQNNMSKR